MSNWFTGLFTNSPSKNTTLSDLNNNFIASQQNSYGGSTWQAAQQYAAQQAAANQHNYIPSGSAIGISGISSIYQGSNSMFGPVKTLLSKEIFTSGQEKYIFADYKSKQIIEFDTKEQYERHLDTLSFNKSFEDKLNEETTD